MCGPCDWKRGGQGRCGGPRELGSCQTQAGRRKTPLQARGARGSTPRVPHTHTTHALPSRVPPFSTSLAAPEPGPTRPGLQPPLDPQVTRPRTVPPALPLPHPPSIAPQPYPPCPPFTHTRTSPTTRRVAADTHHDGAHKRTRVCTRIRTRTRTHGGRQHKGTQGVVGSGGAHGPRCTGLPLDAQTPPLSTPHPPRLPRSLPTNSRRGQGRRGCPRHVPSRWQATGVPHGHPALPSRGSLGGNRGHGAGGGGLPREGRRAAAQRLHHLQYGVTAMGGRGR